MRNQIYLETIADAMPPGAPTGVDINYMLRKLGVTQVAIARELRVSAGIVSNVINNRVTCHRVATHIAGLLGANAQDLWPGRYEYRPRATSRLREENEGGEQ